MPPLDENDLLRAGKLPDDETADAEPFVTSKKPANDTKKPRRGGPKLKVVDETSGSVGAAAATLAERVLELGSDVELGKRLLVDLGKSTPTAPVFSLGELYQYDAGLGIWAPIPRERQSILLQEYDGATIDEPGEDEPGRLKMSASKIRGSMQCAADRVADPQFFDQAVPGFAFANGFLKVTADGADLVPHSPDHRALIGVPYAFDKDAQCPRWLKFLDEVLIGDDALARHVLLQDFTGCALIGKATTYQKCLVLVGSGSNGKSVVLSTISRLFPPAAVTAIAPHVWAHEYHRARLASSLFNAVSELPKADLLESESFKQVVDGSKMTGRHVCERPFDFYSKCAQVFACNTLPGTSDQTHGYWRRFMVLMFERQFADHEQNPALPEELAAELPGITAWAVEGAVRLLRRGRYAVPPSSDAALGEWRRSADPVSMFVEGCCEKALYHDRTTPTELYRSYRQWAELQGFRYIVASRSFGLRLHALGFPKQSDGNTKVYPLKVKAEREWE